MFRSLVTTNNKLVIGSLRTVFVFALAVLLGCSGSSTRVAEPASTTAMSTTTTVVATTTSTTTTTLPPRPDLAISVAFMDQCVTTDGVAAPCRCALAEMARSIPADQWRVMEDRLEADGNLSEPLADALVACRSAEPLSLDMAAVEALTDVCEDTGTDIAVCRCAAVRAVQIVPSDLLGEYGTTTDVSPSLADLTARCEI